MGYVKKSQRIDDEVGSDSTPLDNLDIVEKLKKENEEKDNTLQMLQKQMSDMQAAFIKLQSMSTTPTKNSEKFLVGCRLTQGMTLFSPKREVDRQVVYNEFSEFLESEIDSILTNPKMKDFFRRDVVFFSKESDYEKFRITGRLDISNEKIEHAVLTCNSNELLTKLNDWTKNKHDNQVLHSTFYRIVELYKLGKLAKIPIDNLDVIEKFFKFGIRDALRLVEAVEKIK